MARIGNLTSLLRGPRLTWQGFRLVARSGVRLPILFAALDIAARLHAAGFAAGDVFDGDTECIFAGSNAGGIWLRDDDPALRVGMGRRARRAYEDLFVPETVYEAYLDAVEALARPVGSGLRANA